MSAASSRPITDNDCQDWRADPLRNPHTGRAITRDGPTWRRYQQRCGNPVQGGPAPLVAIPEQAAVAPNSIETLRRQLETARLSDSPRVRFQLSYATELRNRGAPEGPSIQQATAVWNAIQSSLRNNRPLTGAQIQQYADHLDEGTLVRLIALSEQAPPVPAPVQVPVPVERVGTPPGQIQGAPAEAPPAPRRGRQPRQRRASPNADILEIQPINGIRRLSRYEFETYFASRYRLGLNTFIHPYYLTLQSFNTLLIPMEQLCEEFNANCVQRDNVPNRFEFTRGNRQYIWTLAEIDANVAQPIRRNEDVLFQGRNIARTNNRSTLYVKLVSFAVQLGLDLNHMHGRGVDRDRPVMSFIGNPPGSHADFVKIFMDRGVFGRYGSLLETPEQQVTPPSVPGPYSGLRTAPKTAFLSTATSPQDVEVGCVTALTGIQEPFKGFGNKLKKMCTAYSKQCGDLTRIKSTLYQEVLRKSGNNIRVFNNINPEYALAHVFRNWKQFTAPDHRNMYMLFSVVNMEVRYAGQQGIGPGVRRSFVQRMLDEFTIYKIFISSSEESTQRYFINPMFTPDANFKRITGLRFNTEEDFVLFYRFIGHVLTFITMNDIGLKIKLSHTILAHMLYKHDEITDDDYIGYAMMDFPIEFNTFLNLMKNPDWIEASDLTFNDTFPLKAVDESVTQDNYREYIRARYKYRYLHKIFSDDQQPNAPDVYERFKGMVKGMQTIRKYLRSQNVTISMLDKLITFGEMSQETIDALIANFTRNMDAREQNEQVTTIKDNFVRILRDNGEEFPYEAIGIERPDTQEKRKEEFYKFVDRLLMYWTSYRHFTPSFNYFVIVTRPENLDAARRTAQRRALTQAERENLLPEAHTCFQRIDVPDTYYNNFEKLYLKLVQASGMVEAGVGNYGGSKSKKSKSKSKSSKSKK